MIAKFQISVSNWVNKRFAKVVKHGNRYGIRRRLGFKAEYLDLTSIMPRKNIEGGVLYSKANNYGLPDPKVYWWDTPKNIDKYCLDEDMEKVLAAFDRLGCFVPDPQPTLEPVEFIDNINVERALFKIRGVKE